MKKLLIPAFAITALLSMGCDMNKKTADRGKVLDDDNGLSMARDEVRTSAASSYGVSAGSAALGNAINQPIVTEPKVKATSTKSKYRRTAHPIVPESDERMLMEENDYDPIHRQSMEEVEYNSYPVEEYESEDTKLDRLQKENSIFYGYPSATGASGAPGSAELSK
jgi:hypothetical protein